MTTILACRRPTEHFTSTLGGWSVANNVDMATGKMVQANNSEVAQTKVTSVISSPSSGIEFPGDPSRLTLTMSAAVTVSGIPTLSLNDGGIATYIGGNGTNALTFKLYRGVDRQHCFSSGNHAVQLAKWGDSHGRRMGMFPIFPGRLSRSRTCKLIRRAGPTPISIVESPSTGDLNAGNTVTLTLNMSSAVTVAGGTPTLTLNDGGTATYTGGSGTNALTFSYTVGAGQNTASTGGDGGQPQWRDDARTAAAMRPACRCPA